MGSKEEEIPKEPVEKTLFVEDMNETELATAVSNLTSLFTRLAIVPNVSVGLASWPNEFRKHVLHERNCSVFKDCTRTTRGLAKLPRR